MRIKRQKTTIVGVASLAVSAASLLAACAAPTAQQLAPTPTRSADAAQTQVVELPVTDTSTPPTLGGSDLPTATNLPQLITPEPTLIIEQRIAELEWPPTLRLGESDLVRIALVPTKDGFTVTTEFPEHIVVTQTVPVPRPGGYELSGVARLDGIGFGIEPGGEQSLGLPLNERVTWRWTITPRSAGQQRLSLTLKLRWTPAPGNLAGELRETILYDKGLNINVTSVFGLTTDQALTMGFLGMVFGAAFSLPLAASMLTRPRRGGPGALAPNEALVIEKQSAIVLATEDARLLKTLFRRYVRLTLEAEFRSGYSGARTFLALPVRADGRADAYTIAKLGDHVSIQREYENYEQFVKDTLPPITARIQELPVRVAGGGRAALRYTFIGEAGKMPASLRETLLSRERASETELLQKLFSTFGPNWWMQRKPYAFRAAEEYDRMLPAHFVVEPYTGREAPGVTLDGLNPPDSYTAIRPGQIVALQNWPTIERRADGGSLTLTGRGLPGYAALRVRWNDLKPPEGRRGLIVATRQTLLRDWVGHFERSGLPDPLLKLDTLLGEQIKGTQATIHGDLNLENILVGPGGFLWLIDFAQTRDGHTLYDFAHLEAEIIAHIITPGLASPADILPRLSSDPLLATLHQIARRCLFDPDWPREYDLARFFACLGALKFANLTPHQKQVLYLAAAGLGQAL